MQTAAVPSPSSPASAFAPSLVDFRAPDTERIAPYWDEEREEWVGTPTEEEKLAALKALIDEGFAQIDAGLGIEVPHDQLGAFIHGLSEEAAARVRRKREARHYAAVQ